MREKYKLNNILFERELVKLIYSKVSIDFGKFLKYLF